MACFPHRATTLVCDIFVLSLNQRAIQRVDVRKEPSNTWRCPSLNTQRSTNQIEPGSQARALCQRAGVTSQQIAAMKAASKPLPLPVRRLCGELSCGELGSF